MVRAKGKTPGRASSTTTKATTFKTPGPRSQRQTAASRAKMKAATEEFVAPSTPGWSAADPDFFKPPMSPSPVQSRPITRRSSVYQKADARLGLSPMQFYPASKVDFKPTSIRSQTLHSAADSATSPALTRARRGSVYQAAASTSPALTRARRASVYHKPSSPARRQTTPSAKPSTIPRRVTRTRTPAKPRTPKKTPPASNKSKASSKPRSTEKDHKPTTPEVVRKLSKTSKRKSIEKSTKKVKTPGGKSPRVRKSPRVVLARTPVPQVKSLSPKVRISGVPKEFSAKKTYPKTPVREALSRSRSSPKTPAFSTPSGQGTQTPAFHTPQRGSTPAKTSTNNTASKKSVKQVVAKKAVTPVVAKKAVTPVVAKKAVTSVGAKETVTSVGAKETVIPVVTKETVTPVITKETVTPVVTKEMDSPGVTKETVTPVVTKEMVTPVVTKEKDSPVITKETDSPVVTKETVTLVAAKEIMRRVKNRTPSRDSPLSIRKVKSPKTPASVARREGAKKKVTVAMSGKKGPKDRSTEGTPLKAAKILGKTPSTGIKRKVTPGRKPEGEVDVLSPRTSTPVEGGNKRKAGFPASEIPATKRRTRSMGRADSDLNTSNNANSDDSASIEQRAAEKAAEIEQERAGLWAWCNIL